MKNWFKRLLAGAGIGIAASVPGVSGATIAVILKIYKSLVEAVDHLFKNFKKNILFLLPIILGIILAMIPCLLLFNVALQGFVFGIVALFAGLIIGSFPGVYDEVKEYKPNKFDWIILVGTLIFAVLLGIFSILFGNNINLIDLFNEHPWWLYLILIPVGMIASIALAVPGISGSMILLIIGIYKPLIATMAEWFSQIIHGSFTNIGPFFLIILSLGAGIIIGFYFISKLMNFLLNKYHGKTMYAIIGFIIGSLVTLFINHDIFAYYMIWASGSFVVIPPYAEIISGISLMIIAIFVSYQFVKLQRRASKE